MDKFEKATRINLLVATPKGPLNVIDLWQLPLSAAPGKTSLDTVACDIHHTIQSAPMTSFVKEKTSVDENLTLAFDIVKHIIAVKLAEATAAAEARARKEKKQQIMELISQKENQELAQKSIEDLRALQESL